jgi:hypothetical protein
MPATKAHIVHTAYWTFDISAPHPTQASAFGAGCCYGGCAIAPNARCYDVPILNRRGGLLRLCPACLTKLS